MTAVCGEKVRALDGHVGRVDVVLPGGRWLARYSLPGEDVVITYRAEDFALMHVPQDSPPFLLVHP